MVDPVFTAPLTHPFYADGVLYKALESGAGPYVRAWEFSGWKPESMSWKTDCYIHGPAAGGPFVFKGPDAGKYLESLSINSFENFPIGSIKHLVMCTEDGLIAAHAAAQRNAEDEYAWYRSGPWPANHPSISKYDVEVTRRDDYAFQVAGPKSLALLEKVTGESLRDVGFLRFRDSKIDGTTVEVARIGMTGNLAYELRGPMEDAPKIYDTVYEAGKEFGIERLGWRTYMVNHVEGGFPQATVTFVAPGTFNAGMTKVTGSVDPQDMRARYRTPREVRWHRMAKFDHDFVGRAAVEAENANPKRTTVMLRWNPEDVLDTYASLFQPGEEYKTIDMPTAPDLWPKAHADHILKDGKQIGWSSGVTYSYYFHEVISMGCLEIEASQLGTEVVVQWGDYGGRIKEIRATVERFPYLTEGRNNKVDVTTLK